MNCVYALFKYQKCVTEKTEPEKCKWLLHYMAIQRCLL